jgi:DNA polymerase-3 subunit gamma/tau
VESVQQMLGAIDGTVLIELLDALADGQAARLLALADGMAERGLAFSQALRDLASLLHRIALLQGVPETADDSPDAAEIRRLGSRFSREQVQLYYQIALHGRNDLALAPDEYAGFTMTLLRMLAFDPEMDAPLPGSAPGRTAALLATRPPRTATTHAAALSPPPAVPARGPGVAEVPAITRATEPVAEAVAPVAEALAAPAVRARAAASATPAIDEPPAPAASAPAASAPAALDWPALAAALKLGGLARELALRSELLSHEGDHICLRVPVKALLEAGSEGRLRAALNAHFGRPIRLGIEVGATTGPTAAGRSEAARAVLQQQAEDAISGDPFVRELIENFGASVDPRSIRPAKPDA